MSEKLTEYISFCDRKADNVRTDNLKIKILDNLQEKYQIDISFKPYNLLKHTRIPCVDKHPHILSIRTVGNSYFLYLTNIDGVNYCFYIDKKVDAPRHMYPRILSVKYRFSEELFNDTLFDGELICDAEGRWYFILSDVLIYKGQLLNNQTINTLSIKDAIERTGYAVERNSGENRLQTATAAGESRLAFANAVSDLRAGIERNGFITQTSTKDISLELCNSKGDLSRQLAETSCKTDKNVLETKYELSRQACEYKACLEKEVISARNSIERQAAENKASIELEACKNRDAIQRQLSECCCELKEKIAGSNQLMREIESNRVRDALNEPPFGGPN
jgi:hypothetical protein